MLGVLVLSNCTCLPGHEPPSGLLSSALNCDVQLPLSSCAARPSLTQVLSHFVIVITLAVALCCSDVSCCRNVLYCHAMLHDDDAPSYRCIVIIVLSQHADLL